MKVITMKNNNNNDNSNNLCLIDTFNQDTTTV